MRSGRCVLMRLGWVFGVRGGGDFLGAVGADDGVVIALAAAYEGIVFA